jgi:hypothetical protein
MVVSESQGAVKQQAFALSAGLPVLYQLVIAYRTRTVTFTSSTLALAVQIPESWMRNGACVPYVRRLNVTAGFLYNASMRIYPVCTAYLHSDLSQQFKMRKRTSRYTRRYVQVRVPFVLTRPSSNALSVLLLYISL